MSNKIKEFCNKCGRIKDDSKRIEYDEWLDLTEKWFECMPRGTIGIFPNSWRDKFPIETEFSKNGIITAYGEINKIIFAEVERPIIALRVY